MTNTHKRTASHAVSRHKFQGKIITPLILWLCLSLPTYAQTQHVSGNAALRAALAASDGGTIIMESGKYGTLEIKRGFSAPLILKAKDMHQARFDVIRLIGSSNITVDGVSLSDGLAIKEGSKNISILNSNIKGNLYVRDVNGLNIRNVDVSGGNFGVLLNSVQNFSLTNNYIHEVSEDLVRITGNSYNGLIEGNIISDTLARKPLHPDIIQFFQARGIAPHDIVIRRNLLSDPGIKGMVPAQGIFVSDPGRGKMNNGYQNIIIEENLINTASTNTIFINSGKASVVVRNNTLIARNRGGGNIRLVGANFGDGGPVIEGNVFRKLISETGAARLRENFIYGDTPEATLFSGPGSKWQDFLPILGTQLDSANLGAVRFLSALQASQRPSSDSPVLLGPSR